MGQRMVRELTINTDTIPSDEQLRELTTYLRNDMISTPTYDVLWQRLTDYQTLRHVEKSLLVTEHLIINGNKKFIRVCLARKSQFQKLSKYVYKIDGSDIGQNVRRRAKYCFQLLQKDEIINKSYNNYNGTDKDNGNDKIASYDDYFQTADKEDHENAMKRQKEKEKEKKQKEKEKKKKKKKKNDFRKQPSTMSSGDEFETNDMKPIKKPKKKKKKVNEPDFFSDNSSFFDDNNT